MSRHLKRNCSLFPITPFYLYRYHPCLCRLMELYNYVIIFVIILQFGYPHSDRYLNVVQPDPSLGLIIKMPNYSL